MLTKLILLLTIVQGRAELEFRGNSYQGLTVSISPDLENKDVVELVDSIKSWVTSGSQVLFSSSRNWASIKSVKILLPVGWSHPAAVPVDGLVYEDGHVRVARASGQHGIGPFTVRAGSGCGEPGEYIQVAREFLTTEVQEVEANYGPLGQVFVHEWAKYRYGVWEEHGYPGDPLYPLFYYRTVFGVNGESLELEPNYCTNIALEFRLVDMLTGQDSPVCSVPSLSASGEPQLPPDNCIFLPTSTQGLKSSLMSLPYVSGNDQFCDDTEVYYHDTVRPSKHNALCGGKSTFAVIREHPDFGGFSNNSQVQEADPVFEILAPRSSSSFVMVLDVSGSMAGDRIARMIQASVRWVTYDVENNVPLGIVSFETVAHRLFDLQQVTDTNRDNIYGILNGLNANGGTCFGPALREGLQVFKEGGVEQGGIILFLTDGENTCFEGIASVIDDIIGQGVRVVTISFGSTADPDIIQLAERTGGKAFFVGDDSTSNDINNAFQGSMSYQPSVPSDQVDVVIHKEAFKDTTYISTVFIVDSTVGKSNVIQIDFDKGCYNNITVNDIVYNDCDKNTLYKNIGDLNPGNYSIKIALNSSDSVSIVVTSQAQAATVPITTECWTSSGTSTADLSQPGTKLAIMAKVQQGNNPVIRANVVAQLTSDSQAPQTIQLLDNGLNADTVADDGTYTRYFTTFQQGTNAELKYSVVCQVTDTANSTINQGFVGTAGRQRSLPQLSSPDSPICCGSTTRPDRSQLANTGPFSRTAVGGLVSIVNADMANLPPGTVTDLRVSRLNQTGETIELSFTATGDRLDTGRLNQFAVYYWKAPFTNTSEASQLVAEDVVNPDSLVGRAEPGTPVSLLVKWATVAGWREVCFRLVATASNGLSTTSNLAAAGLPRRNKEIDLNFDEVDGLTVGSIIGIVLGTTATVLLVIIAAIWYQKRMNN